jgi:6-phosphogluconolactonase
MAGPGDRAGPASRAVTDVDVNPGRASGVYPVTWRVQPDTDSLVQAVAAAISDAARRALAAQGYFRVVLAGGNTPAAVYRELVNADTDWRGWQVYLGDERCLPPDDPGRNSVMITENWLGQVAVPCENIHMIPAEQGATAAARLYSTVVQSARPFDLVLLGMGEDGHIASLFPGQPRDTTSMALAVYDAPKPPAQRVSLGEAALNDACQIILLVSGIAKHAAIARWKAGEDLPVSRIHGRNGLEVYLDSAADGGAVATRKP